MIHRHMPGEHSSCSSCPRFALDLSQIKKPSAYRSVLSPPLTHCSIWLSCIATAKCLKTHRTNTARPNQQPRITSEETPNLREVQSTPVFKRHVTTQSLLVPVCKPVRNTLVRIPARPQLWRVERIVRRCIDLCSGLQTIVFLMVVCVL